MLMVSRGVAWGAAALKEVPSAKLMLLAVVPKNDPPIFRLALGPKIIPLGLIKNKLAVPLAWIKPSMLETEPPVTRVKIF
jgi:hypothetical protein